MSIEHLTEQIQKLIKEAAEKSDNKALVQYTEEIQSLRDFVDNIDAKQFETKYKVGQKLFLEIPGQENPVEVQIISAPSHSGETSYLVKFEMTMWVMEDSFV